MDGKQKIRLKRLAVFIRKASGLFHINISRKAGKQFLIFLFFVSLSFFIWLMKTLNKDDYETYVKYPVKYINFPSDKVLVGALPDYISIKIKGRGKTLLGYKIRPKINSINFDVSSFSLNKLSSKSDEFYLLTNSAQERIAESYFKRGIEITAIKPDTLKFLFSEKASKKVRIIPQVQYTTKSGYLINNKLQLVPDSVEIFGPYNVIDTIHAVETEAVFHELIDDTIKEKLSLRKYPYVTYSQSEVNLILPIDIFTSSSTEIPISVFNVPDSLTVKIFPSTVIVNYQVAMSKYNTVDQSNFKASVDFKQSYDDLSTRLRVNLQVKDSSLVLNPGLNRNRVEFLIKK